MSRDLPVKGVAELDKFLSALPANMQKAAYRQGLTAAAKPIRDEARLLAEKKTGKMAKAIKTGSPRQNQDGTFSVTIRLEGEHAFLGFFQEFGVAPHFISAGDIDNLSPRLLTRKARNEGVSQPISRFSDGSVHKQAGVLLIGDNYVTHGVMHPGHAAHPFMRPALDTKADEAIQAFAAKIRAYLEGKTGFTAPTDEAA